jgi:cholest-4-en-3-one 26-monooxygenase
MPTMRAPRPLADPNCFDPDYFAAHGYPHAIWTAMRRDQPVAWVDDGVREPFWAITRYEHVTAIGRDSDAFVNGPGVTIMRRDMLAGGPAPRTVPLMLIMDPPEHHKNRMVLRERFKPSIMRALEFHIVDRCREIADSVVAARVAWAGATASFDFVDEIAMRLPLDVILELLGVPTDDRDQMYVWSNAVIGSEDPDYGDVAMPREAIATAQREMFRYFARFIAQRRAVPREDLVSLLVAARIDGEPLCDIEILGFCFLLALAGNETTRNATSGAMLALIEHPEVMRALRADPLGMPQAVEELLRWVTPIVYMARTATRDVEIGGQTIRMGEKVALFYPSANRDEATFAEPFRLDISRTPNRHVTFGFGRHSCLGNDLARIELRAMLGEILSRFPSIHLASPVVRLRSNFVGGIKKMMVSLD